MQFIIDTLSIVLQLAKQSSRSSGVTKLQVITYWKYIVTSNELTKLIKNMLVNIIHTSFEVVDFHDRIIHLMLGNAPKLLRNQDWQLIWSHLKSMASGNCYLFHELVQERFSC